MSLNSVLNGVSLSIHSWVVLDKKRHEYSDWPWRY